MNTIAVDETAYRGAGWAIALIRDHRVIASRYVAGATGRFPTAAELRETLEAFRSDDAVIAAEALAATAGERLDAAERDGDAAEIAACEDAFERAAVRIRHGMMGSTVFHLDFTAAEARALRIPAELRP